MTTYMDTYRRANSDRYGLLKEYAKEMRNNPTEAEYIFWALVKGKNFGIGFKRQVVILDFIADFYAPDIELIVEIDGGYHNNVEQIVLDEERSERLMSKGYKILRFNNEEVLTCTDYVIAKLEEIIEKELHNNE